MLKNIFSVLYRVKGDKYTKGDEFSIAYIILGISLIYFIIFHVGSFTDGLLFSLLGSGLWSFYKGKLTIPTSSNKASWMVFTDLLARAIALFYIFISVVGLYFHLDIH